MWTVVVVGLFLVWLLSVAWRMRSEDHMINHHWIMRKWDSSSLMKAWDQKQLAWDQKQLERLVAVHNRRVDEHYAKSMH